MHLCSKEPDCIWMEAGPSCLSCCAGGEAKEGVARQAAKVLADLLRRHKAAEGCMAAGNAAEARCHLAAPVTDSQIGEAVKAQELSALRPASFNVWRMREQEVRRAVGIQNSMWCTREQVENKVLLDMEPLRHH